MFRFTNWCTYLLVLEGTKIYLKFTIKLILFLLKIHNKINFIVNFK